LGIEIANISFYPISCFLEKAYTEIEGEVPPRSSFPKPAYVISSGARIRFCDDIIDMEQFPCGKLLGTINLDLRYGDAGREKYGIHVEGRVTITMDHSGLVSVVQLDPTHKVA
jgi:hypothetical protein